MRLIMIVLLAACAASPTVPPSANEVVARGEGGEAPPAPSAPPEPGEEAPAPAAGSHLDPSPPPAFRGRWLPPERLGAPATLVLESVGTAPARFQSTLAAGEARCVLSEAPCIALLPGARLERRCPALEGASEVLVRSCPPPGAIPHEVRVATP